MIDELRIAGLGVIEEATLALGPGLTVVTGETGAGKTMIVTALQLLLGARADSQLVRGGADAASAEARVTPAPPTAGDWVEEGDDLIVSREVPADGRSRARINGRLAPVSALAEVLGPTVEVHAQHEHVRLQRPEVQRDLLDRFAGEPHQRTLASYRSAHGAWRDAQDRLARLEEGTRERARELDRLRFELAEIDAAELDPERDARLDDELDLLEHAEEVTAALQAAAAATSSEGAGDPIGVAVAALRRLPVDGPALRTLSERVEALAAEASDLSAALRDHADTVEADERRLAELRERRQVLATLTRKYGADVDAVIAYADGTRTRLAELEREDTDVDRLQAAVDERRAELDRLAATLSTGRRAAGDALADAVDRHLAELGMPHARFSVRLEPLDGPTTAGADRISFELAANPGEPSRPLASAASGGERSRVALAIEVALADADEAAVLVFDEVDAGIGGATAMAVGEKLARLARGRQVLCVTHLAQLAAFADVHHVVEKGLADGRTVTTTRRVADDDREAELSRMLGGDAAREAGLAHARELLTEAATRRAG